MQPRLDRHLRAGHQPQLPVRDDGFARLDSLLNHGVIDVNLSGYRLDDEANIGSDPHSLPSITLKPGERIVFYGKETGLLLSDGGDGVRLLKPNGQLPSASLSSRNSHSSRGYSAEQLPARPVVHPGSAVSVGR